MAARIFEEGDDRLQQNLTEWLDSKAVTDLWIGEYCINAIMAIRQDNNFLDAYLTMSLYLKDEEKGVLKIWRGKK